MPIQPKEYLSINDPNLPPGMNHLDYEVYAGDTVAEAKTFLDTIIMLESRKYVVVETPEGPIGRDVAGLYRPSTGWRGSDLDAPGRALRITFDDVQKLEGAAEQIAHWWPHIEGAKPLRPDARDDVAASSSNPYELVDRDGRVVRTVPREELDKIDPHSEESEKILREGLAKTEFIRRLPSCGLKYVQTSKTDATLTVEHERVFQEVVNEKRWGVYLVLKLHRQGRMEGSEAVECFDTLFRLACGEAVANRCLSCGVELPARYTFCPNCGRMRHDWAYTMKAGFWLSFIFGLTTTVGLVALFGANPPVTGNPALIWKVVVGGGVLLSSLGLWLMSRVLVRFFSSARRSTRRKYRQIERSAVS